MVGGSGNMKKGKTQTSPNTPLAAAELRRRAEARLSGRQSRHQPDAGAQRLRHELEVHQIELEMQNAELRKTRDELELALRNATDLYDFAPVGYFSLDATGLILEANLTGAALLGVERSRLIHRRLPLYIASLSRPSFLAFLKKVFTELGNQTCEVQLLKAGADPFWANFRAAPAFPLKGARKWCRLTFADITARKQAEEAQRRVEVLVGANRELKQEVVQRKQAEEALRKSERHYVRLSNEARDMRDELRLLSRRLLSAEEEERKRISREVHDVIGQALTSIHLCLAALKTTPAFKTGDMEPTITRAQRLVEQTVEIVHRFARELRPAVLDDVGLIPALRSFMETFAKQTGIRVGLSVFAAVEEVNGDKRAVIYRVAQEALTNVARHAQASRVEVEIQKRVDVVRITIQDDGKGLQPKRVLHGKTNKRLGLIGMRERLEMVGGNLTIQSAPGKGTTIVAQIPFPEP